MSKRKIRSLTHRENRRLKRIARMSGLPLRSFAVHAVRYGVDEDIVRIARRWLDNKCR